MALGATATFSDGATLRLARFASRDTCCAALLLPSEAPGAFVGMRLLGVRAASGDDDGGDDDDNNDDDDAVVVVGTRPDVLVVEWVYRAGGRRGADMADGRAALCRRRRRRRRFSDDPTTVASRRFARPRCYAMRRDRRGDGVRVMRTCVRDARAHTLSSGSRRLGPRPVMPGKVRCGGKRGAT